MWHPVMKSFIYNYGIKHTRGDHQYFAQYVPIAKKDAITLGYVHRANKHLNLFGELRASPDGFSETTLGYKIGFNSGTITGTFNSKLKACSSLQFMMDQMLMAQVNTIMDFN